MLFTKQKIIKVLFILILIITIILLIIKKEETFSINNGDSKYIYFNSSNEK